MPATVCRQGCAQVARLPCCVHNTWLMRLLWCVRAQQLNKMGALNLQNLLAIKESGQAIDSVPLETRTQLYTDEVPPRRVLLAQGCQKLVSHKGLSVHSLGGLRPPIGLPCLRKLELRMLSIWQQTTYTECTHGGRSAGPI